MIISSFEQIENLYKSKETESQYLDYKSLEYKIIKDQITPPNDTLRKKDKHELLKDVCSFLNSEGGCILIGVTEDGKSNTPKGDILSAGINRSNLPDKYHETLEQMILTGITPTPSIKVLPIDNRKNDSHCFIAINCQKQNHPLFAVLKDISGNDVNDIFVRRGRNIGKMTPNEIKNRIENFGNFKNRFYDIVNEMKENYENAAPRTPTLLLVASPIFDSFNKVELLNNENVKNLMRGKNVAQIAGHKVTVDSFGDYPLPTFEGLIIEGHEKELGLWENGIVFFQATCAKGERAQYYIDPKMLNDYIRNFFRVIMQYYKMIGFSGEIIIVSNLFKGVTKPYAYSTFQEFRAYDYNNNLQGYKPMSKNSVNIERRLSLWDYNGDVKKIDAFVKNDILDYIWRAFGFETFPTDFPISK